MDVTVSSISVFCYARGRRVTSCRIWVWTRALDNFIYEGTCRVTRVKVPVLGKHKWIDVKYYENFIFITFQVSV